MRASYGIGQLSAAEKSDILNQHKSLYNGYQTMQPKVSNTQPLYVYDPAGDKDGLVVNNKGEVKKYTNFGINEEVEEKFTNDDLANLLTIPSVKQPIHKRIKMDFKKPTSSFDKIFLEIPYSKQEFGL